MRIALIGQAAFGARVLESLVGAGEEVVLAATSPSEERAASVVEAARKASIPCLQPQSWRDPQVYQQFRTFKPELGVMAFVTDRLPGNILSCPRLGTIEYHPSLLPRHRGSSAINWAIIQGETRTGLTIFWVDEGMDTGPLLLQKEVDISPEDTVGSLYFNRLFPLGVAALVEAVGLVREGRAPRLPQDESQAIYEPPIQEAHVQIDWARPVNEVYNLIRGANPQPGATTWWQGQKLKVYDCQKLPAPAGAGPGRLLELTAEGFTVAASGGAILVKRVQAEGSGKMAATALAAQEGLSVGARLGL